MTPLSSHLVTHPSQEPPRVTSAKPKTVPEPQKGMHSHSKEDHVEKQMAESSPPTDLLSEAIRTEDYATIWHEMILKKKPPKEEHKQLVEQLKNPDMMRVFNAYYEDVKRYKLVKPKKQERSKSF